MQPAGLIVVEKGVFMNGRVVDVAWYEGRMLGWAALRVERLRLLWNGWE